MTAQTPRALVVDATPFHRQLAGQMLRRMGFDPVDLFESPAAALASVRAGDYALILLDYAAAPYLRAARRDPAQGGAGVAAVLVTGADSSRSALNAYAEGAQAVVSRPFSFQALQTRIAQAMAAQGRTPPWAGASAA